MSSDSPTGAFSAVGRLDRDPGSQHHGAARLFGGGLRHYLGPAGVSIGCHLLILAVLAVATWAVVRPDADEPFNTEFKAKIVAESMAATKGGGFRFPGRAYQDRPDSARAVQQADAVHDLASLLQAEPAFRPSPVEPGGSGLAAMSIQELARSDVIGVGSGGGFGRGGLGSGLGDRDLAGGGPVGSMWGVGEGQIAKSIVYVMDRSGSMAETFPLLQRELLRAIGSLDADQLFNVIWFNEGPAAQLTDRMLAATIENKRDAFAAIKRIVPSNRTEPIDAVRQGLAYKPDVLFLLSDGDFGEDNDRVIRVITQKNEHKRTVINTILFVYDTGGEGDRVLRAIADANGGTFKHVTEQDIKE